MYQNGCYANDPQTPEQSGMVSVDKNYNATLSGETVAHAQTIHGVQQKAQTYSSRTYKHMAGDL